MSGLNINVSNNDTSSIQNPDEIYVQQNFRVYFVIRARNTGYFWLLVLLQLKNSPPLSSVPDSSET